MDKQNKQVEQQQEQAAKKSEKTFLWGRKKGQPVDQEEEARRAERRKRREEHEANQQAVSGGKVTSTGSAKPKSPPTSKQLEERVNAIREAERKNRRKMQIRFILIALVALIAIGVSAGFAVNANSQSNVLRTSQALKVAVPGDWYSLKKYGIDAMLPSDMEDITPSDLKDFMTVVCEIGYDDEICAEAGFITVPDVVTAPFDVEANSEEMWEKLHPALSRVVQQTYNALTQSVAFDMSWEVDPQVGQYLQVAAEYELQQFTKNKETGAVEPLEDTVLLRVKAAVRDIEDRPVLVWAAYRPGYSGEEEAIRDQRFTTVFQSVIAVGDVTGEDLNYTYEDVATLVTDDSGDPIRVQQEKTEADQTVASIVTHQGTKMEKVLAYLGYFQTDSGWVSDPSRIIIIPDGSNADVDGSGTIEDDEMNGATTTISEEQALELYQQNVGVLDDAAIESMQNEIDLYWENRATYPDDINPNTRLPWGIAVEGYEGEIPAAYVNREPIYESDLEAAHDNPEEEGAKEGGGVVEGGTKEVQDTDGDGR